MNDLLRKPWIWIPLLLILFCIFTPISGLLNRVSYAKFCKLAVPEMTVRGEEHASSESLSLHNAYYDYADIGLDQKSIDSSWIRNSLSVLIENGYKTRNLGLFEVEGALHFKDIDMEIFFLRKKTSDQAFRANHSNEFPLRGVGVSFEFHGFWSEYSNKLCMLGTSFIYSQEGDMLELNAVLKLNYPNTSDIVTSFVTGSLESLDSDDEWYYFEKISILAFSQQKYHSSISNQNEIRCSSVLNELTDSWLSLDPDHSICSALFGSQNTIQLKYKMNTSPAYVRHRPIYLTLTRIHCSDKNQIRLLFGFFNHTTLAAEGFWDEVNNQLCTVACRISNPSDPLADASVGDCSVMFSFRFAAKLTVKSRSKVEWRIWSNINSNDSDLHHLTILQQGSQNLMTGFRGLKYEYTETRQVKNMCSMEMKSVKGSKDRKYPDMSFEFSLNDREGQVARGSSILFSVGEQLYNESSLDPVLKPQENSRGNSLINVGYSISLLLQPDIKLGGLFLGPRMPIEIAAEGIYDAATGRLCMICCRENNGTGCDILIDLHFPHFEAENGGRIKGTFKSTRKSSDPFYFKPLNLSSSAFYPFPIKKIQNLRKTRFGISVLPYPSTLLWIFIRSQLSYVRKNTNVLPFMSLLMLIVLMLGQFMILVQGMKALVLADEITGWLNQARGFTLISISLLAFISTQNLLLQGARARFRHRTREFISDAEKKSLYVYSFLCLSTGGIISLKSCSLDWRSYNDLIVNGFLIPQILLDFFVNSTEKAIIPSFYAGITGMHMIQHALQFYHSHRYGLPGECSRYSTFWNATIYTLCLLSAGITYIQQRFGGRCFVPRQFQGVNVHRRDAEH